MENVWTRSEVIDLVSTTFSGLALAAALIIAVLENRRAMRNERERVATFVVAVVNLLSGFVERAEASENILQGMDGLDNSGEQRNEIVSRGAEVADALDALRAAAIPDAEVILAVTRARRALNNIHTLWNYADARVLRGEIAKRRSLIEPELRYLRTFNR